MQGKASKIELLDTKIYGYLRGFKSPPRPPYCDSDRTSLFQRTMEKTMEFCARNSRGQSSALFNILGYMLKEIFSTYAHGIFPPLSANALTAFSSITGAKRKPSGTRLGRSGRSGGGAYI